MPPKRREFVRKVGKRHYRKLFVIAAEGIKTEPMYFALFNNQHSIIQVNCLKGSQGSSPRHILRRMEDHLKKEALKKSDEAWLVVDKDQWTDEQLAQLHAWSLGQDNYGFALSNPKFEYWLLLHFENGTGIGSPRECSQRLKRYIPDYDKGVDAHRFTRDQINEAVCRAKLRDNPPCADWPRALGSTTVYKLVENIILQEPHPVSNSTTS